MNNLNERILNEIIESGLMRGFIANKLGITVNSLRRKTLGEITWKDEEIEMLEKIFKKDLK